MLNFLGRYRAVWSTIGFYLATSCLGYAQVRQAPDIPNPGDVEIVKVERCKDSLSQLYAWQLGDAKRLREWCRQNGYITYRQQLEAER